MGRGRDRPHPRPRGLGQGRGRSHRDTLLRADDERHAARACEGAEPRVPSRPRLAGWRYEWAKGEIVRRADPLGLEERFANACTGYLPGKGGDNAPRGPASPWPRFDQERRPTQLGAYLRAPLTPTSTPRVFDGHPRCTRSGPAASSSNVPDVDAMPVRGADPERPVVPLADPREPPGAAGSTSRSSATRSCTAATAASWRRRRERPCAPSPRWTPCTR